MEMGLKDSSARVIRDSVSCDSLAAGTVLRENPTDDSTSAEQTPESGVYFLNLGMLHTCPFNGHFPGLPRLAGTRKVKPIWILLKQETVSGSGISWTICKFAPHSRQITTPAQFFTGRMPFLPHNQQRQSTEGITLLIMTIIINYK